MNDKEKFGVEIELITNSFKKKMQDVVNQSRSVSNQIKNQYLSGWKVGLDTQSTEEKLIALNHRVKEIAKDNKIELQVTDNGQIQTTQEQYNRLNAETRRELDSLQAELVKTNSDLNNVGTAFGKVGQRMRDAVDNFKAFRSSRDNVKKLEQGIESLQSKVSLEVFQKLKATAEKLSGTKFSDKEFTAMLRRMKLYNSELEKAISLKGKLGGTGGGISLGGSMPTDNTPAPQASGLFSGITSKFKSVGSLMQGISDNFGKSITNAFSKGIGSIKRFGLALLGIRGIFGMITNQARQLIQNNEELNGKMQVISATFQQILLPVVERIVSWLATAMSYLSSFIQMLTGVNVLKKGMDSVAKSTGSAAKSAKAMQGSLSGIDEINNIAQNDSSGGGSGGGIATPTIGEVQFPDFDKIGATLAEKLNEMMDNIPWKDIQDKAKQVGTTIVNNLNDFVENFHWDDFGKTLAEGVNTALYFAGSIINNFKFSDFGQGIGETINNYFSNIDWAYLGETLSNGVKGAFSFLASAIQEIDWIQLANNIEEFVRNIEWGEIASTIMEMIGSGFAGITLFLGTFITDGLSGIKDFFSEKIEECGGDIVGGILKGIVDGLANIGIWIADNIFSPFIEGFKKVFEIHSPSKVMLDLGKDIVDGLINAVKEIPKQAVEVFLKAKNLIGEKLTEIKSNSKTKAYEIVNTIKEQFENIPNWFKTKFTQAWDAVKNVFTTGGKIFDGIKDGIANTFKNIVNKIVSGLNTVLSTPFNRINTMLNNIRKTEILGVKPFSGLWGNNPISVPRIPSFDVGTDYVPADMLAVIHEGEKIVPKKFNDQQYINQLSNNEETNDLLRELIDVIESKDNNLYVDGKEMAKVVRKYNAEHDRIMGRAY